MSQTGKTITVELRDGKTGMAVAPSDLLLRVDHHDTIQQQMGKDLNNNDTMTVLVPDDAKEISLQATSRGRNQYSHQLRRGQNRATEERLVPGMRST